MFGAQQDVMLLFYRAVIESNLCNLCLDWERNCEVKVSNQQTSPYCFESDGGEGAPYPPGNIEVQDKFPSGLNKEILNLLNLEMTLHMEVRLY